MKLEQKMKLGGVEWLRANADDKHEMLHALGSIDEEGRLESEKEILGLREAACRMEELMLTLRALDQRVHSGYDFNADPEHMSILVERALA
jgi:hypothetical protein